MGVLAFPNLGGGGLLCRVLTEGPSILIENRMSEITLGKRQVFKGR